MRIFKIQSGSQSGADNMALDEALLETLRVQPEPVLMVRTYGWERPTVSLGVNQKVRDIDFLLGFYGLTAESGCVVRRPTGGRAILHGEDISFSFVTNEASVLKQSLKASYQLYAHLIQQTLAQLTLITDLSGAANTRDYLRSPVCFETHTPSDIVGLDGQKLSGSAQLRRSGGLLQHGAAFLSASGITPESFSAALFETVAQAFEQPLPDYAFDDELRSLQAKLRERYIRESGEILANAPVTSGSHFVPASC